MFSYLRRSSFALSNISCLLKATEDPDWTTIFQEGETKAILITFCNPLSVQIALKRENYISQLRKFNYIFADGMLLAKYATHHTKNNIPRRSFDGNSLGADILRLAAEEQIPVALIGGVEGVSATATNILNKTGINVVYHRSGFFNGASDRLSCFHAITTSGAKLVIVGMGSPHQEEFLIQLAESGWLGVAFTCGGYLDQMSIGDVEYYPAFINKYNLRALYRMINEPGRLIPRYTLDYFPFYVSALFNRLTRNYIPPK